MVKQPCSPPSSFPKRPRNTELDPLKVCALCGSDNLQPVMRHALGTSERDAAAISGLLAFRCGRGHVSLSESQFYKALPNT
jgi:hypothetical protein